VGAEASLGVSGAAVLSIGAGSEAAALRLRRGAFGAAGAGAAAAARFGALRGLAAFTFTFGAAALRAVAFAFGAALRTPVVALARADVAFAGFAAALRVAGLAALRVEVFAAAAAARFGAALRAAGFAVARLAAGFAARVVFVAAFFVTAFFAGAFFATAFLAAVFVVFAAAFFAGAFFVAAFAFGFTGHAAGRCCCRRCSRPASPCLPWVDMGRYSNGRACGRIRKMQKGHNNNRDARTVRQAAARTGAPGGAPHRHEEGCM